MGGVDCLECGEFPVTGTEPIPAWMDSLKPTMLSSNSVLLQAPQRFVVMDAGGEPELLRRYLQIIRERQPVPQIPVCFAQTHTHIDHIAGLTEFGALPEGGRYELAVHELGLKAMRAADRSSSLAELTGHRFTPFHPKNWREWIVRPRPGAGATDPDFSILLGAGISLEAFCTPGHSPDSVSWRVNRALFVGDLLAATAPLVAGIAGWDRDALLASLDRFEILRKAYDIQRVHVGHGKPLDSAAVAHAVARARREAGELEHVAPVSVQRVRKTAASADALVDALRDLFAEIARRIARLADKLAQIQESRTADEVRGIDRSHEVRELLAAFAQFKEAAGSHEAGTLGVANKGIQTALRISKLLQWERLDWVLDESLLRYARTRVVDFIQRAKGLTLSLDTGLTDLVAAVRAFGQHLKEQQIGDCRLDDVSGGEAGYQRQLVYCLSRTPSLGTASISLPMATEALPARLDPVRFFDALTRLIEEQVARGATRFSLEVERRGERSVLTVQVADGTWKLREDQAVVWEKVFARGGAQIDFPSAGTPAPLVFEFESR